MSKQKPNALAAALKQQARGINPEAMATKERKEKPGRHRTPINRQGRVVVSGWLPIEARSSFRLIQARHPEKLMQDLVTEAMDDLFAKYNVPQTAKGE
jgi:hypothetical protein